MPAYMRGAVRYAGLVLCALVTVTLAAALRAQELLRPTTVILVRHAEKSEPNGDYPLSPAGRARARELARVLEHGNVAALYATEYLRTQQTAQPLAERLKQKVSVVVTTNTYVTDVVDRIRREHVGQTVLVVTHRNMVPLLIEALGGGEVEEVEEQQYDHLYVLTIAPGGGVSLVELRYGRPTR